jgi:hypothetical protein
MSVRARALVVSLTAGAALLGQACASVLDLNNHENAVAALCQCNEQLSFLGSRCEDVLTTRLEGASEQTRRQWLQTFTEEECSICENALECFYEPPTCGTNACDHSEECCGFEDGTGYCSDGGCVREAEDCKHSFDKCTSIADCCGSEVAGLATCEPIGGEAGPGKLCIELCAPDEANCTACGTVQGDNLAQLTICFDGTELAAAPALLCNPAKGDEDCAAQGLSCQCVLEAFGPGTCIFGCTPGADQ